VENQFEVLKPEQFKHLQIRLRFLLEFKAKALLTKSSWLDRLSLLIGKS
jgi:hypothetical protein